MPFDLYGDKVVIKFFYPDYSMLPSETRMRKSSKLPKDAHEERPPLAPLYSARARLPSLIEELRSKDLFLVSGFNEIRQGESKSCLSRFVFAKDPDPDQKNNLAVLERALGRLLSKYSWNFSIAFEGVSAEGAPPETIRIICRRPSDAVA